MFLLNPLWFVRFCSLFSRAVFCRVSCESKPDQRSVFLVLSSRSPPFSKLPSLSIRCNVWISPPISFHLSGKPLVIYSLNVSSLVCETSLMLVTNATFPPKILGDDLIAILQIWGGLGKQQQPKIISLKQTHPDDCVDTDGTTILSILYHTIQTREV